MEVMHERNAHNFPLDLAAGEAAPVAITAPAIKFPYMSREVNPIAAVLT
jgi:hypothetical protein